MRRYLTVVLSFAFSLVFSLQGPGAGDIPEASAQETPAPSGATKPPPATSNPTGRPAGNAASNPSGKPAAIPPTSFTRTPSAGSSGTRPGHALPDPGQISTERYRPSGFWSSGRPAQGGAYRYRMLIIGTAVAFLMLGFLLWVVRRDRAVPEPAGGAAGEPSQ